MQQPVEKGTPDRSVRRRTALSIGGTSLPRLYRRTKFRGLNSQDYVFLRHDRQRFRKFERKYRIFLPAIIGTRVNKL